MSKLNETRVFVTLIVSVDGVKGGHRQFNTVLHGLDDIERVVGQSAAGMVDSEITRLAVQENRYEEYVRDILKGTREPDTNKPGRASLGPAGQAVQAVEGVTGREAPTGALQGALPDAERGKPATPPGFEEEWLRRRLQLAEGLLCGDKRIERSVDAVIEFKLDGKFYNRTICVPADINGLPLGRPFLLEIRNMCNADMGVPSTRPLINKLHWSDYPSVRPPQLPCGNILCDDQVIGVWAVK